MAKRFSTFLQSVEVNILSFTARVTVGNLRLGGAQRVRAWPEPLCALNGSICKNGQGLLVLRVVSLVKLTFLRVP